MSFVEKNKKTVNRKKFSIKPFKKIVIGDPSYFDELDNGSENKYLKDITCNFNTTCCNVGSVIITENTSDLYFGNDAKPIKSCEVLVDFYLASSEKQLDIYENGKWFGKETLKKEYELGCDTACFEMTIDNEYDEFRTGSDGYYGNVKQLKQNYGLIGHLYFDGDMFTFDEIVNRMNKLFHFQEKGVE